MKKVAVVTGAAMGLGYEFARLLARDGHDLVLVDVNAEVLESTKISLGKEYKASVEILVADLGRPGITIGVYSGIRGKPVDVLVLNAGFGLLGSFAETKWEHEESMINLFVMNSTHLTKLVLGDMLVRGCGRILLVSSLSAFVPGPRMSVYYASKAYLVSFGTALAAEVKGTGVTVTTVCPGFIKTNFQRMKARHSGLKERPSSLLDSEPAKVALTAFRAMNAGKSLVIPGVMNKIISCLCWLLPRSASASLICKQHEKISRRNRR